MEIHPPPAFPTRNPPWPGNCEVVASTWVCHLAAFLILDACMLHFRARRAWSLQWRLFVTWWYLCCWNEVKLW